MIALVLVQVVLREDVAQVGDSFHLPKGVVVVEVAKHLIDSVVTITFDVASGLVDQHLQVVRRVELLQQFEILLKVMDSIGQVVWLLCDLTLIRGKSVSVDTVSVENFPVFCHVATVFQVGQKGLTDRNVIRSGVIVELLVPLLVEMASAL